jgi:RimJ/RimL family protein N-acetyltransferase
LKRYTLRRMCATFDEAAANLTTKRLTLRVLSEGDVEAIWPSVSDPEVSRYMAWSPHASRDETLAFIRDVRRRMAEGTTIAWVIEDHERFCGLVSLIAIARKHRALQYDKAEFAYWLAADARGRGIATEACQAVMRYAFERLALNKLTVSHVAENGASKGLIERLGFRHVGIEYRHFSKDGRWFDHLLYELLRADWRN